MIPEIGHFALVLALLAAIVQAALPLAGAALADPAWMAAGRPAALAQMVLVLVALAALTWAYVVSDFTVANVVANSHSTKPLLYKITGVWGNHEGSMLFWVGILGLFGALVALFGHNLPPTLKARVLGVQGLVGIGFYVFILATSNPFLRVYPPPADGNDLNPLLQDPGLAFHPPFLYLGYVGFSMAFSFAVAALIEGRVDPAWARWVRPWTLLAWSSLTLGIAMGAWWAYYELGWGGWWYWDPVENASLMPWLAGTALLHSAIVVERRDALKTWTVLLAILTFSLSLMGTFLVRSGVLSSVHAFAVDPARGVFILILLAVATGGALALYGWRAPTLKAGGLFQPLSREGALVLNNLLLTTATGTVFVGTLYPLFLDVVGSGKVSVGPPFYNATFVPLMAPLVFLMVMGPLLSWKRADLAGVFLRFRLVAVLTAGAGALTALLRPDAGILSVLGIALAAWAFFGGFSEVAERLRLLGGSGGSGGLARRLRSLPGGTWGTALAHAGLGLAVAGMIGSTVWQSEAIQLMKPGDQLTLDGYTLTLERVDTRDVANYRTDIGVVSVQREGRPVTTLFPEQRFYPVTRMPTTEAAILTTSVADLYVALSARQGDGWVVRAYRHPLVPWLWAGCILMVAGGLLSLADRRFRVGIPAGRRAALPDRSQRS